MRKLLFSLLVFCVALAAANFKLYLKDGGFHLVNEYHVEGDRVRFYSIDRSDWEEMPLDLIDVKRTEAELGERQATLDKVSKEISEEEAAARELRAEIRKIPQDPGVYRLENDKLRIFMAAESTVHTDKGRSVLKALSPVPLVPGKATVELMGEHSGNAVTMDDKPEFFIQLSEFESFGIIKLKPQKGVRIAERLTYVPVSKETIEERDLVQIFTKQMSDNGLYKIWPQEPLPPGEYAVTEYTDGKVNCQLWDFRIP
jgi:hypothetical protein